MLVQQPISVSQYSLHQARFLECLRLKRGENVKDPQGTLVQLVFKTAMDGESISFLKVFRRRQSPGISVTKCKPIALRVQQFTVSRGPAPFASPSPTFRVYAVSFAGASRRTEASPRHAIFVLAPFSFPLLIILPRAFRAQLENKKKRTTIQIPRPGFFPARCFAGTIFACPT